MTTTQPRRFGFKRWIVLGLMVLGGWLAFGYGSIFKPVSPAVVLPPEAIWHNLRLLPDVPGLWKDVWFSNTILSALIADIVLIVAALGARSFVASGKLVPTGFYNFFEWLVEFLWNMTESAAGKWAKAMFPIMATIFMLVFTANMIKLVPGFESIGWLEQAHGSIKGYAPVKILGGFITAIDGSHQVPVTEDAHATEGEAAHAAPAEGEHEAACTSCTVVPFLRATATDLNFTFALAVVAVVMIQYFGFRAQGMGYLGKFINTRTMISKPIFGFIDFGVGLLELVSEFAKILSFGFRLFGNIFAGALLLAILGALTAVAVPSMLYGLETFVGVIQAYVFAMLALTFMSQATVSHGGEEHGEGH